MTACGCGVLPGCVWCRVVVWWWLRSGERGAAVAVSTVRTRPYRAIGHSRRTCCATGDVVAELSGVCVCPRLRVGSLGVENPALWAMLSAACTCAAAAAAAVQSSTLRVAQQGQMGVADVVASLGAAVSVGGRAGPGGRSYRGGRGSGNDGDASGVHGSVDHSAVPQASESADVDVVVDV